MVLIRRAPELPNRRTSTSQLGSSSCRRHEDLLRIEGRAKPIALAREIALRRRGGRHVLDIFEAGANVSISAGVKKLMKGLPLARAIAAADASTTAVANCGSSAFVT
jgi:hypothetical protein